MKHHWNRPGNVRSQQACGLGMDIHRVFLHRSLPRALLLVFPVLVGGESSFCTQKLESKFNFPEAFRLAQYTIHSRCVVGKWPPCESPHCAGGESLLGGISAEIGPWTHLPYFRPSQQRAYVRTTGQSPCQWACRTNKPGPAAHKWMQWPLGQTEGWQEETG